MHQETCLISTNMSAQSMDYNEPALDSWKNHEPNNEPILDYWCLFIMNISDLWIVTVPNYMSTFILKTAHMILRWRNPETTLPDSPIVGKTFWV